MHFADVDEPNRRPTTGDMSSSLSILPLLHVDTLLCVDMLPASGHRCTGLVRTESPPSGTWLIRLRWCLGAVYSITTFIRAITSLLQIRQFARLRSATCSVQGLRGHKLKEPSREFPTGLGIDPGDLHQENACDFEMDNLCQQVLHSVDTMPGLSTGLSSR